MSQRQTGHSKTQVSMIFSKVIVLCILDYIKTAIVYYLARKWYIMGIKVRSTVKEDFRGYVFLDFNGYDNVNNAFYLLYYVESITYEL